MSKTLPEIKEYSRLIKVRFNIVWFLFLSLFLFIKEKICQ